MTENLSAYIPLDRQIALATKTSLPDRTEGAALFADISGFTPLTEALTQTHGPRRGAEELTKHLNEVYDASIAQVERYGGSVIGFSGDAMTCWFDKDDGTRALTTAFNIQKVLQELGKIAVSSKEQVALTVKIAVVVGPVRRFLVGDPNIRYIDVTAGATMDRLATSEHHAKSGEVIIDELTAEKLQGKVQIDEWREDDSERFAIIGDIITQAQPQPDQDSKVPQLTEEEACRWLIPTVYERLSWGLGEYIAELRSAVSVFVKFSGIDYDDDEEAGVKLDAYVRWVQGVLAKYGGTLLDLTIGDKGSYLHGAFGAPISHDDDTYRAMSAVQELRTPPPDLSFITGSQIGVSRGRMRSGPYGGTRRRAYSIVGDEANVAARLMEKAAPGQVIVSDHIADAVGDHYHLDSLGDLSLKGKAEPVKAFSLGGTKVKDGAGSSPDAAVELTPIIPIIGRLSERAILKDKLDQLVNDRRGGTVIIEGDAGIGKSRLVEEIIDQAGRAGAVCAAGAGDAIEQATLYHGWKPIFYKLLGFNDISDDAAAQRDLLISWLADAGDELIKFAPLFTAIAPLEIPDNETTSPLSSQVRAETTREFLAQIIEHYAQTNDLLIVLDDAFWLDSSSWALAQRVAALSDNFLFALVTRPFGDRTPQEYPKIAAMPNTQTLTLDPLGSEDVIELVKQRLGVNELPDPVKTLIHTKAEGNPFFSEEIAYALRDAQLIIIHDGRCKLAPGVQDLLQMDFPDKVEDVIISRIDLLAPQQEITLKVASVIGRIFAYRTLRDIHPVQDDVPYLIDYLNALAKVDLTPLKTPDPDLAYMFKHIITEEVAYNLMLFEQRRNLHQAIGEWFEKNHSDALPNYYSTLAYHWQKVAEGADADPAIIAKAVNYLYKAGEQAVQNYANPEASSHLKDALSLLKRLPPSSERDLQELGMKTMLAYSLVTQRGYGDPEVEAAYHRARALSEKVEVSEQLSFILYGIFSFHASRAEYETADQLANRLMEIGKELDDKPILAVAHQSKGIVAFCRGDLPEALVHVQTSYDIAQPLDSAAFFQFGGDFQAYTSSWLALTHLLLGYPDKAQAVYENALILTEKQPYPHSFVLGFAFIPQLKNNIPETIKRAQELIGLSERYAFVLLGLQGNIFNAWVMATAQENPLGVQILESITPVPKMVKLDSFVPWYLALLGQAQSVHGKQESAVQSIDEALTYAESAGGNFYQAELHRVKGDILKAQGSPSDTVEQQYREALALARSQSARWWELRAATSLAELLIEQEQSRAAYDLLVPVFNWFTEGFDSPDLIKAQSLLSNLQ